MSIEGLSINGVVHHYVYDTLEYLPELYYSYEVTASPGYFNANGGIDSQGPNLEIYTNRLFVKNAKAVKLEITYTHTWNTWVVYCIYDKNEKIIGQRNPLATNVSTSKNKFVIELPETAYYVAFSFRTFNDATYSISYIPGDEQYRQAIDDLTIINYTEVDGYLNEYGDVAAQTGSNYEKTTNFIPVTYNEKIHIEVPYSVANTGWFGYAYYDKDYNFISPRVTNNPGTLVRPVFDFVVDNEMAAYVRLSYRSFNAQAIITCFATVTDLIGAPISENKITRDWLSLFSPYYDHLFINKVNGGSVTIPSESLFNIQTSRRLGFKVIEANVKATSDNYIVCHGGGENSLYFGGQFEHIDGATDISGTLISSVSLEWVKTNVRYKSLVEKYKTAPLSLAEFLLECKKNGLVPLVQYVDDEMVEIVNYICGEGNFILYGGRRELTKGPIMLYSSQPTKAGILAACTSVGKPCLYNMANPNAFTDEQLKDIVNTLHDNGYWIGAVPIYAGMESTNQRLRNLGFDFMASAWSVPDFDEGNMCNLSADLDYTDFATTGTVSNNVLTLSEGQTLQPSINIPSAFLAKGSLHILFKGKIKVTMGEYIVNTELESNGDNTAWLSTYYNRSTNTFLITALEETTITNITFKCSKV